MTLVGSKFSKVRSSVWSLSGLSTRRTAFLLYKAPAQNAWRALTSAGDHCDKAAIKSPSSAARRASQVSYSHAWLSALPPAIDEDWVNGALVA